MALAWTLGEQEVARLAGSSRRGSARVGEAFAESELDDLVDVASSAIVQRRVDGCAMPSPRRPRRLACELEAGAPGDDVAPVLDEALERLLQRERPRAAADDREDDDAERRLQRGEPVELVQDDLRHRVLLQLDRRGACRRDRTRRAPRRCPRCFFSRTSSAMLSTSRALFTW